MQVQQLFTQCTADHIIFGLLLLVINESINQPLEIYTLNKP